jgi:magnesium transporter
VDAVLSCVTSMLADDVLELQFAANAVIVSMLEQGTNVDDHSQEVLRQMKNSVQEMTSRVDGFNRALDKILEDYEDMTLMNLSRLLTHPERFIQPVPQSVLDEESDEPELILEAHLQRGHTLNNGLHLIQGQITSTEEYAECKSDEIRNRLLYINLLLQTLSLSVAIGSFVGSIFGMNVMNGYEDSSTAFYVIIFATLTLMAGLGLFVIVLIRRVGAIPKL